MGLMPNSAGTNAHRVFGFARGVRLLLHFCVDRFSFGTSGSSEHFMQAKARKIILITAGVILLALGLLNTVPEALRFFYSDASSLTLMINNFWALAAVCGAVLCVMGLFTGTKQR